MAAQGSGQGESGPNLGGDQTPPRGEGEQTRDSREQGLTPLNPSGVGEEIRTSAAESAQEGDVPQQTPGATQQEELRHMVRSLLQEMQIGRI